MKWPWPDWWRNKRSFFVVGAVVAIVLILVMIRYARPASKFPTAAVQRKEFVEYAELRGSVKAVHSLTVSAPPAAGDLQILKIVPTGTKLKQGDVIVEFDTTTIKQTLAQDQSALKSADAEIQQAKVASRQKEEQDQTDIMKARFAVESAKMETQKQEILSVIEGQKAKLALADAERNLVEAEDKLKADRAAAAANLTSKEKKRDAAEFQFKRDEAQLAALTLHAPIDATVVVEDNWQAAAPMQPAAPFKAGDHAFPGMALAELPDASSVRITARIEEAQRGKVQIKQSAIVRVDAVPDRSYNGVVDEISSTASMDFNAGWPFPKNFTMGIAMADQDDRLTPGMGAQVRVAIDRVAKGLVLPSETVFRKEGRSVVYVRHGSKFEERAVEVARRSGDEVLIESGVKEGEEVALKDPTLGK
ncbi:MAG TPA: HlyD family secretion protein [Candidatus Limnocylindrales bacterium]|nr:HlyD family secretion protein [Candidatus Limnocylindrales bacterium]